jgi:membrane protein DedA with SNARE-associated domain
VTKISSDSENFINEFGQFIENHQAWAAPVIGLLAFGESLVLVGLFIPATPLMILVGGLIGSGVLPPVPVLFCSIVGAVLGDIVSYALGRLTGPRIVYKWPLSRYRHKVARTRLFFRRYGFAAIFFGRFIGPIRCTVPLVAGMMAMDQRKFQAANVLSALAWAPLMFAPGWFIGRRINELEEISELLWLGLVALMVLVTLAVLVITRKFFQRGNRASRSLAQTASSRCNKIDAR